jgi:uncharacterized protein YlzI (FlbEa/FlbD family)
LARIPQSKTGGTTAVRTLTLFRERWDRPARIGRARKMIQLTRLNNQPLIVNSDLIKFVERAPDTVLTLVTGEKVVVRETSDEVLQKITSFRRSILAGLGTGKSSDAGANPPGYPVAGLEDEKR